MKHFPVVAMLLAFVFAFSSCNQNEPTKRGGDDSSLNQPDYPSTWSPVGKKYVCDRSQDNPYDFEYCVQVIQFINELNAAEYLTTHTNLTPMDEFYNAATYTCKYPNIKMMFGADERLFEFKDTLTLYSKSWNRTFTLTN